MKNEHIDDSIDEEMLKSLDGLPVSKDFIEKRDSSRDLFNMMVALHVEKKVMSSKESYSKLTSNILNKKNALYIEKINADNIIDFSYKIASVFDFDMLELPVARDGKSSISEKAVYLNKGIEVSVFQKKIYLKISNVKDSFEIKRNDKIVVKISNKSYFDMELEEGSYKIIVDDYNADIIIK